MKLYFLGTCAGTEPMKDRKHASFALECGETLYWFDAGEGCSYTGHNMGLDLLKVRKIILSHTHYDHIGGLPNLLMNIRKLKSVRKVEAIPPIDIYTPNRSVWETILELIHYKECTFKDRYPLITHDVADGHLFDDGTVRVTALHNNHVMPVDEKWMSYSFLIEAEGKRLVYSGDVKAYEELDPLIGSGCDGIIIETGHHKIDDVYFFTKDRNVGRIFFFHNGREILYDTKGCEKRVSELFRGRAVITYDTMTVTL